MAQITINLSAKADAMIAQLQKEIFNRRRKKVTAQGVVETLVESGAKSQSDKRYATSWKNLIKDIEKAAKVSEVHGSKPASISAEEWALVLSHRTRKSTAVKNASTNKRRAKTTEKAPAVKKATAKNSRSQKSLTKQATSVQSSASSRIAKKVEPDGTSSPARPARRARRRAPKATIVDV